MKESRLIQMERNVDTLGRVAQELTHRLEQLKMVVMGDHEVIKRLGEFPEIIKQMQDEQENANTTTGGDSGEASSDNEPSAVSDRSNQSEDSGSSDLG